MNKPLVCLVGPTACGKTDLSLALARIIPRLELIYADSMAVYRYLDQGTAKPSEADRRQAPHHLVDFLDPARRWSAFDFSRSARRVIRDIHSRDGIPLVVGGTGFFLQALYQPLSPGSGPPDHRLRLCLEHLSTNQLYALLRSVDPCRSDQIGRHNRVRLVRALEIWYQTGLFPSAFRPKIIPRNGLTEVLLVGLHLERETIRSRIVHRVERMFDQGIVEETAQLLNRGYRPDSPALQNFTYAPVVKLVQGLIATAQAKTSIIKGTFSLLKRQYTWFRRVPVGWIQAEGRNLDDIAQEVRQYFNT